MCVRLLAIHSHQLLRQATHVCTVTTHPYRDVPLQLTCKRTLCSPCQQQQESYKIEEKDFVVSQPNTVVNPRTMVIKSIHSQHTHQKLGQTLHVYTLYRSKCLREKTFRRPLQTFTNLQGQKFLWENGLYITCTEGCNTHATNYLQRKCLRNIEKLKV